MSEDVAAYLHTMHYETGETNPRLSFSSENPFGKPGKDYSAEYEVTVEPLYRLSTPAPADASVWRKDVQAAPYGERILLMWDDFENLSAHVELGKRTSAGWVNTYGRAFSGDPTDWMPLPNKSTPPRPIDMGEIERALEALNIFVKCAYIVSEEIDPRGHRWCEAWLDQALPIARQALAAIKGEGA